MKKTITFFAFLLLTLVFTSQQLKRPEGQFSLDLQLDNGWPTYWLSPDGEMIVTNRRWDLKKL